MTPVEILVMRAATRYAKAGRFDLVEEAYRWLGAMYLRTGELG